MDFSKRIQFVCQCGHHLVFFQTKGQPGRYFLASRCSHCDAIVIVNVLTVEPDDEWEALCHGTS